MTTLKLCIIIFLTRLIYDLILHYSKPLYLKVKENIKKIKISYDNKHSCFSCKYYIPFTNICGHNRVFPKNMKRCNFYIHWRK